MRWRVYVILLLTALLSGAEPISWYGDFDRALRVSRQSGRPMLVVLVERGCRPCGDLLRRLASDGELVATISERTIPVLVTRENEDYPVELLYTLEYPTLFLLSPEETFLGEPVRGEVHLSVLRRLLEEELPHEGRLFGR